MARVRGRPSLCTPALTEKIVACLERGIPFTTACEAEGVALKTAEGWLTAGASGGKSEPFFRAVTRARARGRIYLHDCATDGGRGSAAALSILSRRDPQHYGALQRIELAGHDGGPVRTEMNIAASLDLLTIDELRRLAAAAE